MLTSRPRRYGRVPSGSPSSTGGEVEETVARVGGGALPLAELESFACAVEEALAAPLRLGEPPVVGIVRDGRLLLDCRTLADGEVDEVAAPSVRCTCRLTVGTAGHIDHGKTWLVRALTGKDTDRLPEEQAARDLDRPRLRAARAARRAAALARRRARATSASSATMVAGATGIDLFLLVIDAAEGARPQTHEHLAILRLLGIERGVVAVTKADAVDEETLELALDEARELVPEAEVVAVSAKTGAGLDELRAALARAAADGVEPRARRRRRGSTSTASSRCAGSAPSSTGTLWSGSIGEGDELRVEPRRPRRARPQRPGARPARSSARRRGSASRSPSRASSATRLRARRRARRAGRLSRHATGSTSRSTSSSRSPPAARHRPPRHRRRRRARRPRRRPLRAAAARARRSSRRAATASCCATRRRVGGGVVLDPPPPRRARRRSGSSGSSAARSRATVHAPVRAERAQPPRRARGRRARGRLGVLARVARRAARRARRAARRGRPARPGHRRRPPSRGRRRSCRCSGSSGAARASTCPARTATLGGRRTSCSPSSSAARARPASRSTTPRSRAYLEQAGQARPGRRRARGVGAAAYERARAAARRASATPAGGSRSPASATCSAVGRRAAQLLLERFDADGAHAADRRRARPPPRGAMTFWIALALVAPPRRLRLVGVRAARRHSGVRDLADRLLALVDDAAPGAGRRRDDDRTRGRGRPGMPAGRVRPRAGRALACAVRRGRTARRTRASDRPQRPAADGEP